MEHSEGYRPPPLEPRKSILPETIPQPVMSAQARDAFIETLQALTQEPDNILLQAEMSERLALLIDELQKEADQQSNRELWFAYQLIQTYLETGLNDKALAEIPDAIELAYQLGKTDWQNYFEDLQRRLT